MFVNRARGREFGEKRVGGGAHNLERVGIGKKGGMCGSYRVAIFTALRHYCRMP